MTVSELKALAKTMDCSIYYLAYALEKGEKSCEDAYKKYGGAGFIWWSNQRWAETCRRIKVDRHACSAYIDEHLKTLVDRLNKQETNHENLKK